LWIAPRGLDPRDLGDLGFAYNRVLAWFWADWNGYWGLDVGDLGEGRPLDSAGQFIWSTIDPLLPFLPAGSSEDGSSGYEFHITAPLPPMLPTWTFIDA